MTDVYDSTTVTRSSSCKGRRSRRISSDLWVRVGGTETALRLRRGDLCATGIYVTTTDTVGSPGDVVMLSLASHDKSLSTKTLARITRVIRQDDRDRGARVIGAAFEFLPIDKLQDNVVSLLNHVATCELKNYGLLRFEDSVHAQAVVQAQTDLQGQSGGSEPTVSCELRSLGRQQLTLSTNRPLPLETQLRVRVDGQTACEPLAGTIASVSREAFSGPDRYTLLIRLNELSAEASEDYAALIQRLIVPDELTKRRGAYYDFSGQLASVPMDEILSLIERERYSGILSAGSESAFFSFGVKDGEIVECETEPSLSAEVALERARALTDGEFKFRSRRSAQLEALAQPTARLVQDVLDLDNTA